MNTYSKKYLPLLIGAACAVGIIIGSFLNFSKDRDTFLSGTSGGQKLDRLLNYINYDYVDKVNTDSIVNVAIGKILSDLDPHSTFIPKTRHRAVEENMNGGFIGIGIQYFLWQDTVAVIRTIKGGPGAKAGIKPGDRILYADGKPIFGKSVTISSLQTALRGKKGTEVRLKIKRPGQDHLLTINLKRERIPLRSVDAAFMLTPSLGYIKINRFSKTTFTEFKTALQKLEQQGATAITLDLRNNGGGYLKEAIEVADEFLKEGKLIVYTKDRQGNIKKTYATGGGDFENNPVYVLINQNTASASEVLTGALQDNDVGTIVGRRSYGKGLVQREMPLGDGSAVRLTVARYYTPTGRSIQRPYTRGDEKDYFHNYLKRYEDGELLYKDSIPINDSLQYTTPGGKIVYGGGGIIPDIFIPKDLSYKKERLDYLLHGGVMSHFVFDWFDKNRAYYNSLSESEFKNDVPIGPKIMTAFKTYLSRFHRPPHRLQYEGLIKTYLKAVMAKQLFGTNAYEKIILQKDPMIRRVLRLAAKTDKTP